MRSEVLGIKRRRRWSDADIHGPTGDCKAICREGLFPHPLPGRRIQRMRPGGGIQFADQPRNRNTVYSRPMRFDMICAANEIEHRLTTPNPPWTNGQVERMNRTIKNATVKQHHYDSHDQLRSHPAAFLDAYKFAHRLKILSGLTPYE